MLRSYSARITCVISGTLGIFALASLITAIVINLQSSSYISSRFSNSILRYRDDQGAKNEIDLLQNKYRCCGTDTWLDWSRAELDAGLPNTGASTTSTTATTAPLTVTDASTTTSTMSIAPISTSNVISAPITDVNTTGQPSGRSINEKRDRDHVFSNPYYRQLDKSLRKKRQVITTYGDILGLPISFGITLPSSCCTSEALLTNATIDVCKYQYFVHP